LKRPSRINLPLKTLAAGAMKLPMHDARTNSQSATRSSGADDEHRVVPFRPRKTARVGHSPNRPPRPDDAPASPVRDLAQYESENGHEDNYRHRMMVNVAALLVTAGLALAGVWLALQIADMRKNQDCVLSGRRNCMPIDVNTLKR
jgi:hypothetical protein